MEAIVLAGGFGTRLRQVVTDVPKSMAPIAGRPFLEILLGSLARKGFQRIVLSLGFMAEKISDHFGTHFAGLELAYVVEETPLGTGGAVRLASTACTQDHVFVLNGDTYVDLEADAELVEAARDCVDEMLSGHPAACAAHLQRWLGQREELLKS